PANACQQCDPARSTLSWSPLADGTACGAGQLCAAGACGARCLVDGQLYAAGAANPANACERCDPAASTAAWTALAPGAACDAGKVCEAGACQAGCAIDGVFHAADAVNPADACQQCSPAASTTAWSARGAVPLLVGGLDIESQGWSVFQLLPASLTYGPDYVRVATSTTPGASTSGALLLAYAGAYDAAKPFTVRVEALVESVSPHNPFDSGAAILGAYTPPFGVDTERRQMVYLDSATLGWADDSQSAAAPAAGEYHTYELSVDADRVARLSVDGVATLTRNNFTPNGTIAVGDQTNDRDVDGAMRIRSVTRICP
ncbi:MAG TPA: hypothetical protein VFS00_03045, partial [Polyangiaceae bacterium]|nr:hypothetical protein [Polyangiaceae bacterium]